MTTCYITYLDNRIPRWRILPQTFRHIVRLGPRILPLQRRDCRLLRSSDTSSKARGIDERDDGRLDPTGPPARPAH